MCVCVPACGAARPAAARGTSCSGARSTRSRARPRRRASRAAPRPRRANTSQRRHHDDGRGAREGRRARSYEGKFVARRKPRRAKARARAGRAGWGGGGGAARGDDTAQGVVARFREECRSTWLPTRREHERSSVPLARPTDARTRANARPRSGFFWRTRARPLASDRRGTMLDGFLRDRRAHPRRRSRLGCDPAPLLSLPPCPPSPRRRAAASPHLSHTRGAAPRSGTTWRRIMWLSISPRGSKGRKSGRTFANHRKRCGSAATAASAVAAEAPEAAAAAAAAAVVAAAAVAAAARASSASRASHPRGETSADDDDEKTIV